MVSFLLSFLVAQAVTEYSGLNFTSILLNEFDKIKNRTDFDPTTINSEIKYRYDDQPKKLNVSVEINPKMQITGLSKLQLREVDLELQAAPPMKFDLSTKYYLPKLRGDGFYKLRGKAFGLIPVKGNGPFYIQIENISGFVNLTISHNGTQFVVETLNFDLHFTKIKHYFQNLIYTGFSKISNTIMNSFSKQLVYKLLIKNKSIKDDVKLKLSSIIDKRLYKLHSNIMNYVKSYVGLNSSESE